MSKPEDSLDFDDRYGRKRSPLRFTPYVIFSALLVWLFWSATYHSNPVVTENLLSFKSVNEKSMGVLFEITRNNPNQEIDCTLQAVDIDKFIVGEVVHRIPAGAKHLRVNATIPTRALAVSASVVRCQAAT
jgi:hypothetical protein